LEQGERQGLSLANPNRTLAQRDFISVTGNHRRLLSESLDFLFELHRPVCIAVYRLVSTPMAAYIRRPLARTIFRPPRCLSHTQTQTQTRHYRATPMTDEGRVPAQPSMKVAMKQNVELPTDLGLLTGSPPPPHSSTLPSRAPIDVRNYRRHIHHAHRRQQALHPHRAPPPSESRMAPPQSPRH